MCVYSCQCYTQVVDIEEMIQERQHKIERLKYSLEHQKVSLIKHILKSLIICKDMPHLMTLSTQSSYLREVRESQKVFSALVHAMEKSHKAVVVAIEEKQKQEEKRVDALVQEIEDEIQNLRRQRAEPDPQVSDQSEDLKDITTVSTCT